MKITEEVITFPDGATNKFTIFNKEGYRDAVRIFLPAMGVRASFYRSFSEMLCREKKETMVLMDLRGLGHSSVRASRTEDFGYRHFINDLQHLINYLTSQFGFSRFHTMGHSLGGQIACLHASRYPEKIAHTTIIATCLPYYRAWNMKGIIYLWVAGHLFHPLSQITGYFPGNILGFAGKESRTVMKDWSQAVRTGKYVINGSAFDYEKAMKEYRGGITSVSYDEDDMSSPCAVDTLLNKFSSSNGIRKYTVEGYDHFSWARFPEVTVKFC